MLDTIRSFTYGILPRHKSAPNGWTKFNAVCCTHNGETPDSRMRGGVISNGEGNISYHCFNCGFTANYTPGYHLNYKFRKLLSWLGASEQEIQRLKIEALRIRDMISPDQLEKPAKEPIVFKPKPLPEDSISFMALYEYCELKKPHNTDIAGYPDELVKAVEYIAKRKIDMQKYDFYLSGESAMRNRVIVPFNWKGHIVGYTARHIEDAAPMRYINSFPTHYVFNVDKQKHDSKFVIVCEGPFDAMSIDSVAVMGNEVSEDQADIIEDLGREVIVIPDRGKSGQKLIDAALKYGWSVSFPLWLEKCKDVNAALQKYGKLFVLKDILDSRESSKLKIELRRKSLL